MLSVGLPDPSELGSLSFSEPTIVYDRSGKVELARFQQERRRVLTYERDPAPRAGRDDRRRGPDVLDERGLRPPGDGRRRDRHAQRRRAAAPRRSPSSSSGRGCCPEDVIAPGADVYLRKAKEVIQAARLTQAFPGEAGKQQIITAYLNEIFYGHDAYGIAAAANAYFGVSDLSKLTPAQAALLAGLPQSPSTLDPYRFAVPDKQGRLVVPQNAPAGRRGATTSWPTSTSGRWTHAVAARRGRASTSPSSCAATGRSCLPRGALHRGRSGAR